MGKVVDQPYICDRDIVTKDFSYDWSLMIRLSFTASDHNQITGWLEAAIVTIYQMIIVLYCVSAAFRLDMVSTVDVHN